MNLLLVLGIWVGVSVPVALLLGGFLGRDRSERDLSRRRDHIPPTQLA